MWHKLELQHERRMKWGKNVASKTTDHSKKFDEIVHYNEYFMHCIVVRLCVRTFFNVPKKNIVNWITCFFFRCSLFLFMCRERVQYFRVVFLQTIINRATDFYCAWLFLFAAFGCTTSSKCTWDLIIFSHCFRPRSAKVAKKWNQIGFVPFQQMNKFFHNIFSISKVVWSRIPLLVCFVFFRIFISH